MTEAAPDQHENLPVVLDAMGGDRAPSVIVDGAILACERGLGPITLVGDESRLRTELDRHTFNPNQITLVHAPEAIGMGENPVRAARSKRESSMHLAYTEVVEGRGIATISAGNSGAFMAAGILTAKRTPGCDRPSIAACVPTGERITVLTDVGANVECRAAHLVQFAIMGATYHSLKFKGERPTVGLLANGTESTKGTDVLREAHRLLNQTDLNYLGYVESRELPNGCADIIVTDGLVGNIVLKLCEGMVTAVFGRLRRAIRQHWLSSLVAPALKKPFNDLHAELSWENIGGAPLLGLRHTAIVAHGSASPLAIANCVARARDYAELGLNEAVGKALQEQAPGEQVSTAELPVGRSTDEYESDT